MKKFLSVLAIGVASAILVVPGGQAYGAGGCVSKAEWSHVHRGMPMSRVHRIFGTSGRVAFRLGSFTVRRYRPCPHHSKVKVGYRKGRVSGKVALWHMG